MTHPWWLPAALLVSTYTTVCSGCKTLQAMSALGEMQFSTLTEKDVSSTGRPSFFDSDKNLYLFHVSSAGGNGRWAIAPELFGESSIAFIDSWSVHPTLIHAAHDTWELKWFVADGIGGWALDPSFGIVCSSRDDSIFPESTFFFDSGPGNSVPDVSGFFLEVEKSHPEDSAGPLYVLAGRTRAESMICMYRYAATDSATTSTWIIGQDIGTNIGIAYVVDDALEGSNIRSQDWNFLVNGSWVLGIGAVISGDRDKNVYFNMRKHRSLKRVPAGQEFYVLRNFVPVPAAGFGTGGLRRPEASVEAALRAGYRLLDLGREYRNEHMVGSIFERFVNDDLFPSREEVFLVSKVWPTDLGFRPTTNALYDSLADLKTNYLDNFLLHWPACYHHIEWMHCEDIVEPEATWRESWWALEKAYAEGTVLSIGVSNFGVELMEEMWDFANVRPHTVQNFADPSNLDMPVRRFCFEHDVLYTPYAMQRNYNFLSDATKTKISAIASAHHKSPNEIIMRMFFQSRSAVIPRSDHNDHIVNNLKNLFGWRLDDDEMIDLGWQFAIAQSINGNGHDEEL